MVDAPKYFIETGGDIDIPSGGGLTARGMLFLLFLVLPLHLLHLLRLVLPIHLSRLWLQLLPTFQNWLSIG